MKSPLPIHNTLRGSALVVAALFAFVLPAQEAPTDLPDLRDIIAKERSESGNRAPRTAVVSITGRPDAPVEVRNRDGELLERIPTNSFAPVGQVNADAIARIDADRAARDEALAARKKAAEEALEQEREAEKGRQEADAKQREEAETQWQADFAASSDTYKARRRNRDNVKAVKIDARQIRDGGTVEYEGKSLKPVRLWSTARKRYEMAIPVEAP